MLRKQNYTDTERECKNIILFVYGITRSKQLCICKPDKNEYILYKINGQAEPIRQGKENRVEADHT